jgi:hypothetical protein
LGRRSHLSRDGRIGHSSRSCLAVLSARRKVDGHR